MGLKERFISAYSIDPHKYQKKGPWMYLGYILLVSNFTILPKLFTHFLPLLHQLLPPNIIPAIGMIVMNLFITLVYNIAMIVIYKIKHPFFEQFRVNQTPWMWQADYEGWKKLLNKSLLYFVINNIIVAVPLAIIDASNSKYKTSLQDLPHTFTILWQFLFFLLSQDFFFYWFHRAFHHPKLYWIHKTHHQYTNTITFAAETSHPLQAITGSSLPFLLGFKILSHLTDVHVVSVWVFFVFRIVEGCDSHSGYEWGWAQAELLPFNSGSAYHSFHHSHNVGNFGSFFKFWDTLFGTNAQYIKYRMNLEKVEDGKNKTNERQKEKKED